MVLYECTTSNRKSHDIIHYRFGTPCFFSALSARCNARRRILLSAHSPSACRVRKMLKCARRRCVVFPTRVFPSRSFHPAGVGVVSIAARRLRIVINGVITLFLFGRKRTHRANNAPPRRIIISRIYHITFLYYTRTSVIMTPYVVTTIVKYSPGLYLYKSW